ncbi:hypothetical protein V6N12_038891 [Hibiscus sabdariffa]|uniref:B box-type domain-containing protein n=1 Tax=Hibiscus sabdariffa TaxID=183260 RepID=A0ABR2E075_9ROSI
MAIAPPSLRPLPKSLFPKYPCFSHGFPFRPSPSLHLSSQPFRFIVRANSAVAVEPDLRSQQNQTVETELFSCPVCYDPLIRKGPPGLNLDAIYRSGFKCKKCNKSYSSKDVYLDLTVTAGLRSYTEVKPARTELFRSPLVSFLYERGWRQNFNLSGFPGADEEFRMAQEYFKPVEGGTLVDVSCGSGLFSRKFAKSGTYSGVIALDFSENMLRQCNDFIKQDASVSASNIALVRADVSRLPFSSGSIDAVHAGAALHCWPSPSNAFAEISRILRSGGVFVGSTFLRYTSSTPWLIRPFRERVMQSYNYLTEEEIEELCTNSGLTNYSKKGIQKPAWLEGIFAQKFFVGCSYHESAKKNEKNVFCLDCCISICPHCVPSHAFHRLLQVRRYVYHDVVRLEDVQKLIDCSNVQAYTINSAKVVFIKKRPQNRQFKGAGNYCTSCDRSLQEPFIHCSLGCKVDYVLEHYKDLSPFLRKCNTLRLSPDFLIPQDIADDGMAKISDDQDMATSIINRRKGIPHRSPLG